MIGSIRLSGNLIGVGSAVVDVVDDVGVDVGGKVRPVDEDGEVTVVEVEVEVDVDVVVELEVVEVVEVTDEELLLVVVVNGVDNVVVDVDELVDVTGWFEVVLVVEEDGKEVWIGPFVVVVVVLDWTFGFWMQLFGRATKPLNRPTIRIIEKPPATAP